MVLPDVSAPDDSIQKAWSASAVGVVRPRTLNELSNNTGLVFSTRLSAQHSGGDRGFLKNTGGLR